jgi:micrococcal nuclease
MSKLLNCFSCFKQSDDGLELCTIENTVQLSFKGETKQCKVLSVYDGDTCTITFKFNNMYYKWKCRLQGINSPEIRTKDTNEKKKGYEARDYLSSRINGKIVSIHFGDFEKYGRLLGTIYLDGVNINQEMIQKKYAVSYMADDSS